jgi:hypothetical protein
MMNQSLSRVGIALLVLTSVGLAQNYFYENFTSNSAGWTLGTEWAIGPATASSGQVYNGPDPSSDADGVPGGGVAGVVIGGNAATVVHPAYYLTSPVINLQGIGSAYLSFARWLNSDYTPYMQNFVDVFDGVNWVNVFITGSSPGVGDNAWVTCLSYNVSQYANANFQVRFGFLIGSTGVFTVSSWNVDNVSIDATPSVVTNLGQSNSAAATLQINGISPPVCGGYGTAAIPSEGSINLNWSGPALQPYALVWSPTLTPGGALVGCIGSVDIGTPFSFFDIVIVFDGNNPVFPGPLFVMNSFGSAYQTLSIPQLPSGTPLGNMQGLVFQPVGSGCPVVLTQAWALSVQ